MGSQESHVAFTILGRDSSWYLTYLRKNISNELLENFVKGFLLPTKANLEQIIERGQSDSISQKKAVQRSADHDVVTEFLQEQPLIET